MGILRLELNGHVGLGVRIDEEIIDLSSAVPKLPNDIADLLRAGPDAMAAVSVCPGRS